VLEVLEVLKVRDGSRTDARRCDAG